MAIGQQLEGTGGETGETRIVGPEQVAAEIGNSEAKLGGRGDRGHVQQLDTGLRNHPGSGGGCEGRQLASQQGAGREGPIGIHELHAIGKLDDGAHVIEGIGAHAGDEEADRAAGLCSGLRPSGEAVVCVCAELNGNVAVVGRTDGKEGDLWIGGGGHGGGCYDQSSGRSGFGRITLACGGDRGFAALGAGGGGEKAGGVDDADGGVTAGHSVDGPSDAGIVAGDDGRELGGLTYGDGG